jgi:signal transduction histidine kinase
MNTEIGRILVVDDNDINREVLVRRLQRQGHYVRGAADGREALEAVAHNAFDLMLLDIMMPVMNGFQVLEYMHADPALANLPVIVISALDDLDSVVRCIELGADDYLTKPFNPVLLRARVAAALEKNRLRQQAESAAALAERNRLARELHDAVSQTLFAASLIAEVLPNLWEIDPEEGKKRLAELRSLSKGALAEMRTLLLELRPKALAEADLPSLFQQLKTAVGGRARLPIELNIEGYRSLPVDVKITLYRIAQESLNNVVKHAEAEQVLLTLHCTEQWVRLTIQDDGRGFSQEQALQDRLGLGIMGERAEAIGATLKVESHPGQGTTVAVFWPFDEINLVAERE